MAQSITVSTAEVATGAQGAGVGLDTPQPMTKTSTKVPRASEKRGRGEERGVGGGQELDMTVLAYYK